MQKKTTKEIETKDNNHFIIETESKLVQVAKLVSYILIPIVIACGGWSIQKTINNESLKSEYLQIATNILTLPSEEVDSSIRDWAVELVVNYSPVKFSSTAIQQLKSGDISLPINGNLKKPTIDKIIISPPSPASAGTTVNISVTASSPTGIRAIRFKVDGNIICEFGASSADCSWDTTNALKGFHLITIEAVNSSDNTSQNSTSTTIVYEIR